MAMPVQVVEGQQAINSLSLIENMDVSRVAETMNKIAQFQTVVQKTLKAKHDYGVIPGTEKPTLLKPGAEKILMLMGLSSSYEVVDKVQDYDGGFFAFTVRCLLSRNGLLITEGVGHANTREKRYTSHKEGKSPPDPYTLANTVLKMAKKRALVDAALTVASLSDIFTQDLEDIDMDAGGGRTKHSNHSSGGRPATDKQLNFISRKAKAKGISDADLDAFVQAQLGKHVDELTSKEASAIIDALDSYEPPAKGAPSPAPEDDPFAETAPLDLRDEDLPF
ncbi:hypothetical protein [Alicyclobacillus shizuokensis]|uniref:hypothetical protein n=1 Tax=Alicyclobacillus shizuokensis TaxID=392014 RepID=UPI000AE16FCC|nr:hypothetical protein [Alicyclobacillus shizuokensis]